jgi:AraC-like DNA-binding protein
MNEPSTMPKFLSSAKRALITELIANTEFLPLSCLRYCSDEHRVIAQNRVIPDDFIYIPIKGTLTCRVGDTVCDLSPGEYMMVPAGVEHGATMSDNTEYYEVYALHMHIYDSTRHRFLAKFDSPFGRLSDQKAWFSRIGACVNVLGRDPETGGVLMERIVTALLFDRLISESHVRDLPEVIDERISRLLHIIRTKPNEELTVKSMASICYLSVSRFRELFVQTTGTSPKKYVQRVRLSLARSLLATMPHLTVEQVADRVGFADVHYFHALYRDVFGETPRKRQQDDRLLL